MERRTMPVFVALIALLGSFLLGSERAEGQVERYFENIPPQLIFDANCGDTVCLTLTLVRQQDTVVTAAGASDTIALIDRTQPTPPFFFGPRLANITLPDSIRLVDTSITIDFCFVPGPNDIGNERTFPVQLSFDTLAGADPMIVEVELVGRTRAPNLTIVPPVLDFGNVTVGQTSNQNVTVTNNGDAPIDLSTIDSLGFPFSPISFPEVSLEPGQSVQVQISFSPLASDTFRDTLTLFNGDCREPAQFIAAGAGLDSVANIGPVLQIITPEFDTTLCGTLKCRQVIFRNVGTDPLNITEIDDVETPFTGQIGPLPITIPANQERSFTVCYEPTEAGSIDSLLLNLVADNRVSLTIATLFDVSGSMRTAFGTTTRIDAANDAGRSFLANLVNDPGRGVLDEGAVYQFGELGNYQRLAGYNSNIPQLQAAVPTQAPGGQTCLFDGIVRTATELGNENEPGRRVMVVLADGANNCGGSAETLQTAIQAATSRGIRVYTIGIGAADAGDLTAIATQTGGFYSEAVTPNELLESYQTIANSLSRDQRNTLRFDGRSVAPLLLLDQDVITYDSTDVGNELCRTFTITNGGDAPLENLGALVEGTDFRFNNADLSPLAPGDSRLLTVCFEPTTIRERNGLVRFDYVRCSPLSDTIDLEGVGTDSVTISFAGSFVRRPGSTFSMSIDLLDNVPEGYAVDSMRFVLRYNKTVLYPNDAAAPFVRTGADLADLFANQNVAFSYGADDAFLDVTFVNGRLIHPQDATAQLATIEFLALHGNTRSSAIEVISAIFADGNPRVGITGSADLFADSLCFHDDRLVDASARFGPAAKLVTNDRAGVLFSLDVDEARHLEIDLYDITGRHVAPVAAGEYNEGTYLVRFDWRDLPSGPYIVAIRASDGTSTTLKLTR